MFRAGKESGGQKAPAPLFVLKREAEKGPSWTRMLKLGSFMKGKPPSRVFLQWTPVPTKTHTWA